MNIPLHSPPVILHFSEHFSGGLLACALTRGGSRLLAALLPENSLPSPPTPGLVGSWETA